jgi:hypothetical protein
MASVRFKPLIFCSTSMELVNCATRMDLAFHGFFYTYKAVHFSLFKQSPFQRKQALIKIRFETLNKIEDRESFVDADNGMYVFK